MFTFKFLPINNSESQYPVSGMPTSLRTTGLLKSLPSHSIATTAYFTYFAPLRSKRNSFFLQHLTSQKLWGQNLRAHAIFQVEMEEPSLFELARWSSITPKGVNPGGFSVMVSDYPQLRACLAAVSS